jgi:hypothetical protein
MIRGAKTSSVAAPPAVNGGLLIFEDERLVTAPVVLWRS